MSELLENWVKANNLDLEYIEDSIYSINNVGEFLLLEEKSGRIIDEELSLILYEEELGLLESRENLRYVLYEFGSRFYYTEFDPDKYYDTETLKATFEDFKFLGKRKDDVKSNFVHLGIHSEYELLNGSRAGDDWVKKAKFLRHKSLGIIDKNTLGGTLSFQMACTKAEIKPLIGETIDVCYSMIGEKAETNELIVFAKNEEGWMNLLAINKAINVDNDGFIDEEHLKKHSKGIVAVLSKESVVNKVNDLKIAKNYIKKYASWFDDLYYQLDSVDYFDEYKYKENASSIYKFLNSFCDIVKPILIGDSYYLDKEEAIARIYLNETKKVRQAVSHEQHYKTTKEHIESFYKIYDIDETKEYLNGKTFFDTVIEAIDNTKELSDGCTFKIDIGKNKLPKFECEEDRFELFFKLINKGLKKKVIKKGKDVNKYLPRIEEEADLIVNAGFVDYLLILWDIIKHAKDNDIGVGTGRGSVGGSLLAYLLDITDIDPIKHDLLFERFLNKTRVLPEKHYTISFENGTFLKRIDGQLVKLTNGKSIKLEEITKASNIDLDFENKNKVGKTKIKSIDIELVTRPDQIPDIDIDFATNGKDEVKRYMVDKYGENYVCSVGTYNTARLKGAIKDFARCDGMNFAYVNTVNKYIEHRLEDTWEDLLKDSLKKDARILKEFIQKNPVLVNSMKHILNQAKTQSVHASAVIIVPKEDDKGNKMDIFQWMPVRKILDKETGKIVLVSEWEGKYLDRAGFLKEDILGLSQLDKFKFIIKLIKKLRNEDIDLSEIPLDDQESFDIFSNGYNEDVFQMGSYGLKKYCQTVKPDTIEDIVAINALYRPGPMKSNAHTDYAEIKHGKKKAKFDFGMDKVTKNTYGLYIYQESIMQAMVVAGLTLAEADQCRTYIKKFNSVEMNKFKEKFITGMTKKIMDSH